jgi:hypothetical protein
VWKSHSSVSKSHSCVWKSHSCVWKSHSSVCKSHSCVWKYTRACENRTHACENHTCAFLNHTRACVLKNWACLSKHIFKNRHAGVWISHATCHFHTFACRFLRVESKRHFLLWMYRNYHRFWFDLYKNYFWVSVIRLIRTFVNNRTHQSLFKQSDIGLFHSNSTRCLLRICTWPINIHLCIEIITTVMTKFSWG